MVSRREALNKIGMALRRKKRADFNARKVPLRYNPAEILTTMAKRQKVDGKFPPWRSTIELFPPPPPHTSTCVPSRIGCFEVKPPAKLKKPFYLSRPPNIVYPEDSIREKFYGSHIFEMEKPSPIVDTIEDQNRDVTKDGQWKTDDIDREITGERFQILLQSCSEKEKAYEIALEEFYTVRANQEKAKFQAQEILEGPPAPSTMAVAAAKSTPFDLQPVPGIGKPTPKRSQLSLGLSMVLDYSSNRSKQADPTAKKAEPIVVDPALAAFRAKEIEVLERSARFLAEQENMAKERRAQSDVSIIMPVNTK